MVIERMICLSNGSTMKPVDVRKGDYNVEIRLLVYERPQQLMDLTGKVVTVSYEKDGIPEGPYEATVEDQSWLRFAFPASVCKDAGNGSMQVTIYGEDELLHSYTMPFIVEHSIGEPLPGTVSKDPAPAFFSLVKEGDDVIDAAKGVLTHPPMINTSNQWEIWDPNGSAYENTGKLSIPRLKIFVATGEPGTEATIEQSGTPEEPVLLITIPRGEKGFAEGVDYSDHAPAELQIDATPGTSMSVARGDHVHPMPGLEKLPGVLPITAGGTGAKSAEEALRKLGAASVTYVDQEVGRKASTAVYSAMLAADGWSDAAPYTQTAAASGILATDVPLVDVDMSGVDGTEDGAARQEAWGFVGRVAANTDGQITAYCYDDLPEVDIPLILKVVR